MILVCDLQIYFYLQHFQPLAQSHEERRDPSNQIPNDQRNGTCDEWKNINTMLNCILSMVEKTKRALAILQQRGNNNFNIKVNSIDHPLLFFQ